MVPLNELSACTDAAICATEEKLTRLWSSSSHFIIFFITTTASHETENSFSMSFFVREFLLYKKKYKMSFRTFWVMGTQKVGNSRQKLTKKLGYHRLSAFVATAIPGFAP